MRRQSVFGNVTRGCRHENGKQRGNRVQIGLRDGHSDDVRDSQRQGRRVGGVEENSMIQ